MTELIEPRLLVAKPLPQQIENLLINFGGYAVLRSYFGGGTRVHALMEIQNETLRTFGNWIPACHFDHNWNLNSYYGGFSHQSLIEELVDFERLLKREDDTQVNCLRCLKRLGLIAGYPGPEGRFAMMKNYDQVTASAIAWRERAIKAEAMLLRLGVDIHNPETHPPDLPIRLS